MLVFQMEMKDTQAPFILYFLIVDVVLCIKKYFSNKGQDPITLHVAKTLGRDDEK